MIKRDRQYEELYEWDWAFCGKHGQKLHHGILKNMADHYGATACGYEGYLAIPGWAERQSIDRCVKCCKLLGFPTGTGSPKNDGICRPLVIKRLQERGFTIHVR